MSKHEFGGDWTTDKLERLRKDLAGRALNGRTYDEMPPAGAEVPDRPGRGIPLRVLAG